MTPRNSKFPLTPVHVAMGLIAVGAGLVACYGSVMAARPDLVSMASATAQDVVLPAPKIASTPGKSDRLPFAVDLPYRSLGKDVVREASAYDLHYYCRYFGFDASNQMHYVTGPTSRAESVACPAAKRLCVSKHLRRCQKYGLFRND